MNISHPFPENTSLNCAQKVLLHCQNECQLQNADLVLALRGFGSGLGSGRICGCITGGAAAIGQYMPVDGSNSPCKEQTARLLQWFEHEFGTTECSALKERCEDGDETVACDVLIERTANECVALLKQTNL